MKYEIGDEVYWNDPDENIGDGYGVVMKIKGITNFDKDDCCDTIYCLKMDNGEELEAFDEDSLPNLVFVSENASDDSCDP